jgi:hypothetical protein
LKYVIYNVLVIQNDTKILLNSGRDSELKDMLLLSEMECQVERQQLEERGIMELTM